MKIFNAITASLNRKANRVRRYYDAMLEGDIFLCEFFLGVLGQITAMVGIDSRYLASIFPNSFSTIDRLSFVLSAKDLWLMLYREGGTLQPFFAENNIKNIAFYGRGKLAGLFLKEMTKYGVNVKFCNKKLNEDDMKEIELICASYCFLKKQEKSSRQINCNVVTLSEIITGCCYKHVIVSYCERNSIRPYILSHPYHKYLSDLSDSEKILVGKTGTNNSANKREYILKALYSFTGEDFDEYLRSVRSLSPAIKKGLRFVHSDIRSQYVNIAQGIRFTHFSPALSNHTIHFTGHCEVVGFGVDDSRTIESCLQKMLTPFLGETARYRVLNHGIWGPLNIGILLETLKQISHAPGDIVIIMLEIAEFYRPYLYQYYKKMLNGSYSLYNDMYEELNKARELPVMIDAMHLSWYGMQRVANRLFKIFSDEGLLGDFEPDSLPVHRSCVSNGLENFAPENKELDDYIKALSKHKKDNSNVGAVVMNCNPFTKGHRYLIEQAAGQVDSLFVFVVEEDKSVFQFKDRIGLVEAGTKDIKNITVLPSGKFILSAVTFPEYFVKDALQEIAVDTSTDIEIFAQYIAPALNIRKRFVGQEPFDRVTRQYNQSMKDILPGYGIELIEIERRSVNNQIISASFVRKLLEEGRFDEMSDFVPETTLHYLKSARCQIITRQTPS